MTTPQPSAAAPAPTTGALVTYAGGLYRVASINGDLLVLHGVAGYRRSCRESCTVLATDVRAIEDRAEAGGGQT